METDDLSQVWKALSDPTRRRVLDLLREQPHTTGELSAEFEVSRYAVMKHLNILEKAGLIIVRREGRRRWNHLNAVPLRRIYERWVSAYESHWAGALLQVKRIAEHSRSAQREAQAMDRFHIEQKVYIDAEPLQVFDALTEPMAWWSHSFSDSPHAIQLEPQVGGRFFEVFDESGDGALYAVVNYIKQGETLRMTGPMGMRGAVVGVVRFDLESQNGGTLLALSHRVIGEVDEETHIGYDDGWRKLLETHLKNFVERGLRVRPATSST
jgi:DNA-binding transcriptional ArsR family regulator/uncharacterized protein YndB with AHSA1/START domain